MASLSSENASQQEDTRAHRRKSCDLCFKKKIKCDMLLPVCSNCVLYKSECRTSLHRRRAGRQAKQTIPANDGTMLTNRQVNETSIDVTARLSRIEERLQEVLEKTDRQEQHSPYDMNFDPLGLPALEHLMPWVHEYFDSFNVAVPLFQQKVFDELLFASYNNSATAWAAVLSISAIGLRMSMPGETLRSIESKSACAEQFAAKALSVVFELASTSRHLLGVQVMVALAVFFNCCGKMDKASTLISMAVNMANRMQLYSKSSTSSVQDDTVKQRHRVFWILFAAEKMASYNTNCPSMLAGAHIDIPPPSQHPSDGEGVIWSCDKKTSFTFFRKHLDLTLIHSEFSRLRTTPQTLEGRATRLSRITAALTKWYNGIPTAFRLENVNSQVSVINRMQMSKMYHAYIFALLLSHRAFSKETEWLRQLSDRGREAAREIARESLGHVACEWLDQQGPPSSQEWELVVDACRSYVNLYENEMYSLMWSCQGTYYAAIIVVLANRLISPSDIQLDCSIVQRAVQIYQRHSGDNGRSQTLQFLLKEICGNLETNEASSISSDVASNSPLCVSDLDLFDQLEATAVGEPICDNSMWEVDLFDEALLSFS